MGEAVAAAAAVAYVRRWSLLAAALLLGAAAGEVAAAERAPAAADITGVDGELGAGGCVWSRLDNAAYGCPLRNVTAGAGADAPSALELAQRNCARSPDCVAISCSFTDSGCMLRAHPSRCSTTGALSVWSDAVFSFVIVGGCRADAACRLECHAADEAQKDNRCSGDCDCDGARWCSATGGGRGWCQGQRGHCREGAVCRWSKGYPDAFLPCFADAGADSTLRTREESMRRCVQLGAGCAGVTCNGRRPLHECSVRDPRGCFEGAWLLQSTHGETSYVKTCCPDKARCPPDIYTPAPTEEGGAQVDAVFAAALFGVAGTLLALLVCMLCFSHRRCIHRRGHHPLRGPSTPRTLRGRELRPHAVPSGPGEEDSAGSSPQSRGASGSMGAWQRGRLLGAGTYGKVFLGVLPGGELVAVKVLSLLPGAASDSALDPLLREVDTLSNLRHPHIVKYLGAEIDTAAGELHLFMEYLGGGSLGAMVRRMQDRLLEATAAGYVRQVLTALEYIHERDLAHRDVKGDNVLLARDGTAKLADFGCARRLAVCASGQGPDPLSSPGAQGTIPWMAPEVLRGEQGGGTIRFLPSADVWSAGCFTVELVNFGRPPWPRYDNTLQAMYAVAQWRGPGLPPATPVDAMSPGLRGFCELCLDPDHRTRPPCAALLQHSWLRSPPAAEQQQQQQQEQLLQQHQQQQQRRTPPPTPSPAERPGLPSPQSGTRGRRRQNEQQRHAAGGPWHRIPDSRLTVTQGGSLQSGTLAASTSPPATPPGRSAASGPAGSPAPEEGCELTEQS
eukprot:TRINITY_DN19401_c2_g1_i1.p1 TRINITY_DN19401_c2_g1~~TRINITY_DN19401_c2_g1_i1.p1  ORF type:complete len:789 (+),score=185.26 TRINITY_DN19401_c2_g1_i1:115-2481(+)